MIFTAETVNDKFKEEKMKDRDLQNMLNRQIDMVGSLGEKFAEHVEGGNFMDNIR